MTPRILRYQDKLKAIWQSATEQIPESSHFVIRDSDGEIVEYSVLKTGWKIQYTPKLDLYELFKIYYSTYYKYPDNKDIEEFYKKGFLVAAYENQIRRWKKRRDLYANKIRKAGEERNDSVIIGWQRQRKELMDSISTLQERLNQVKSNK